MKETEEELYMRVLRSLGKEATSFNIAKLYHSERLAQSLPTEEEITDLSHKWIEAIKNYKQADRVSYKLGLQDAFELLTKEEK